jgi:hypothetical protein
MRAMVGQVSSGYCQLTFPMWLASGEHTAAKGDFPSNLCLPAAWEAVCRPQRTIKLAARTVFGASPPVFGHSFPVASIGGGAVPVMRKQPWLAARAGR